MIACVSLSTGCAPAQESATPNTEAKTWLAGDHHIHSRYSVGWDTEKTPPAPIIGGDAIYPTPMNALMAKHFGLSWMVTTDHGGPNHSKINRDVAHQELEQSRVVVSDVVQFYGMELNTPGGDHSSLIIPHSHEEAAVLHHLESEFDKLERFPLDPSRDSEDKMIDALKAMRALEQQPIVIANHPSRSATGHGEYGLFDPAEFRRWNDAAPEVAVGMAGAPGHQAIALTTSPQFGQTVGAFFQSPSDDYRVRGAYFGFPTMGGFDQMTAELGGFWDSMLGEGRHWWITANSDSHKHYSEGGIDFWPGEYSKTYVLAHKNHNSILAGLRAGHVFVTTGDLVSEVYVDVAAAEERASIGEEITVPLGTRINVSIRILDPISPNGAGQVPTVSRVDLILGEITGLGDDATNNRNASTRVERRFTTTDWKRDGRYLTMHHDITVSGSVYVRVRGTNTDELEPLVDPPAEDPWQDLWFYTNPVVIQVR